MAKAGDLFKQILLKGNAYRSDLSEFIDTLNGTDVNFPSDIDDMVKSLNTEDNFKKTLGGDLDFTAKKQALNQGRSEVYDKIDSQLKAFVSLLPEAAKANYDKLGDKATAEKNKFILDYFQERSSASENASGDAKTFKKNLEELQAKMASDYVPKSELDELNTMLGQHKTKLYNKEILTAALFNENVADSVKKERWFNNQFLSDTNALVASKGWEIDIENNKIKEKGSDTFALREGTSEAMDINDLISQVASVHTDYLKKSDGSSSSGQYESEAGKQAGGIPAEELAQLERMNSY